MTHSNDSQYYRCRAERARVLSANALDAGIAAIHREMAERYDQCVASTEDRPRHLNLVEENWAAA